MITEGLIRFFTDFVRGAINLLPTYDAPDWITDADSMMSNLWTYGYGLGAWIPWSVVGTVVTAVLFAVGIGLTLKLGRIVASFFTVGGGSAG